MTTFVVAPYRPEERESIGIKLIRTTSDLLINTVDYKNLLQNRWSGIKFHTSQYVLLGWFLPLTTLGAGINGGLENDQQTVFLDTPFDQFFLWHRSVIPVEHRVFLSHEGSWEYIELKPETSLKEIQRFCSG